MPSIIDTDPWPAAKFSYWVKYPVWSLAETAALLLGREPHRGDHRDAAFWISEIERAYPGSAAIEDYFQLIRLLDAVIENGDLARSEEPAKILRWADRKGIPYPEELREALSDERSESPTGNLMTPELRQRICDLLVAKSEQDDIISDLRREIAILNLRLAEASEDFKSSSGATKRLNSLRQLALAVLSHKYGYRGKDVYFKNMHGVVSAINLAGYSLTDDTIRNLMVDAEDHVQPPSSWSE